MNPVIRFDKVQYAYGKHTAIRSLSFSLHPGERLALLGPSGCGKTTVLHLALGFLPPSEGNIYIGDALASDQGGIIVPPQQRGIGMVFQDLALWPHLSLLANLTFGLAARGIPKAQREERAMAMLARVSLADKATRFPDALSGGERQRVAIARALVLQPRVVLLDEPMSNLDIDLKRDLMDLCRQLFTENHSAVIYVTHDLREALRLCDRFAVMEAGRLIQLGTLEEFRSDPASGFVNSLLRELD